MRWIGGLVLTLLLLVALLPLMLLGALVMPLLDWRDARRRHG